MEYAWNVNHEDISKARAAGALIANGTYADPFGDTNHGTAVLGILGADANGFGVTSMVKNATIRMVNAYNTDGYAGANAIAVASAAMSAGDVLLVEQQIDGPGPGTSDYVPLEWIPSIYDAIRTATAQNIIVVEAGGNGGQNLNDASLFGSSFPNGQPDSGAIIVGAGGACNGGTTPRNSRLYFSSYGSRVNVQGNGECVTTTGYGNLYSTGGVNAYYTNSFNGTSSASATIAGTAAAFSSAYKQLNNVAPTVAFVRSTLQTTGTAQNVAAGTLSGNIGPLPNLAAALPRTDLTAPSAPTNLSVSLSVFGRKPTLKWTAATDNVAVTNYKIYRNNTLFTTITPSTTWTDNSAASHVTYQYQVSAVDKAGRESPKSNLVTVAVP